MISKFVINLNYQFNNKLFMINSNYLNDNDLKLIY